MSLATAFATTVPVDQPTNGNLALQPDDAPKKQVSNFITVQSLTNFAAMTGAVTAAWGGAQGVSHVFDAPWFPFLLCLTFAVTSFLASKPAEPRDVSGWAQPLLIAIVNAFVLFGAVVGTATLAPGVAT